MERQEIAKEIAEIAATKTGEKFPEYVALVGEVEKAIARLKDLQQLLIDSGEEGQVPWGALYFAIGDATEKIENALNDK